MGNDRWNLGFIAIAETIASLSKDPSTKVGAVIVHPRSKAVVAVGFNGFPRQVAETEARWKTRPEKYNYVEHAERNAIYNAARHGMATEGCWLYLNWDPFSFCPDCARAIIQAGITHVFGPENRPFPGKDANLRYDIARAMLLEARVTMIGVTIE